MVKNMRIELRVDEDERELWKAEAAKDGLSISAWLRQLARVETEFAPKVPEREEAERPLDPMCVERQEDRAAALSGGGAAEDASEHWSGVVDAESESLPSAGSYPTGPVDPAQLTKLIKQLEAQGNPDAEEVARKRLGM